MKTPENVPDNNVGRKTPEEIKKDAETCMNHPYMDTCNSCRLYKECHGISDHIVKELYDLVLHYETRLAQTERERDAAVVDIRNAKWMLCHVCKNYYRPDPDIRHYACKAFGEFSKFLNSSDFSEDGYNFPSLCGKFKWRGICAENTKEENAP